MRAMHEHGIHVPKQVSIIGIDNEPAAAFAIPSLSSVSLPIGELTQQAISLAVEIANKTTRCTAQALSREFDRP